MTKVIFICGFIGSGKTSYANKLAEQQNAFRFSIDEWMIPLFGEHLERELFEQHKQTLTDLFKLSAQRMLDLGVPVIFDFGFWSRSSRNEIRQWARDIGLPSEMHYLDVDFATCRQRALHRNTDKDTCSYQMDDAMLTMFWQWFEIPGADEQVTVITND